MLLEFCGESDVAKLTVFRLLLVKTSCLYNFYTGHHVVKTRQKFCLCTDTKIIVNVSHTVFVIHCSSTVASFQLCSLQHLEAVLQKKIVWLLTSPKD